MALGPEETDVVASSSGNSNSSSSNSISDSRAALVVAVVPEVGVALDGAVRLQGRSSATGVVELAMSLPTAQMLQPMW